MVGPSQLLVFMANNGGEKDNNDSPNEDLSKVVKENTDKISLLESGQQEIINQLRLPTKNLGKQALNDDASSNQNNP